MYNIHRLTGCYRIYCHNCMMCSSCTLCFFFSFNSIQWTILKTLIQFQYARQNLNYRSTQKEKKTAKKIQEKEEDKSDGSLASGAHERLSTDDPNWIEHSMLFCADAIQFRVLYSVTNAALFSSLHLERDKNVYEKVQWHFFLLSLSLCPSTWHSVTFITFSLPSILFASQLSSVPAYHLLFILYISFHWNFYSNCKWTYLKIMWNSIFFFSIDSVSAQMGMYVVYAVFVCQSIKDANEMRIEYK